MKTKDTQSKKPNIFFRLAALAITAALVIGALALVVYRDRLNLDSLQRWLAYRSVQTDGTGQTALPFTYAGGESVSVAYLNDGILFSSASGAHYYSPAGELYAEEVLSMEHPILSASGRCGVVYDAGGQSLFLFQQAQEAFSLSLDGDADLLSARVNDSGWLTVTAQQSGYKGAVTVYDGHHEKVIEIRLSSTFVVDAALSPDCKTVAIVTINQQGGSFSSQVSFYPVNQTTPTATIDLGTTMVLDLDFETDFLWVLGEDSLQIIQNSDHTIRSYNFGSQYLKGCNLNGNGFAMLLLGRYRTGIATTAVTIGSDGNQLAQLPLHNQVLDFDCSGTYCSLLTGSSLTVYSPLLEEYSVFDKTQNARYTALSRDGRVLLANPQQAWLYIPN